MPQFNENILPGYASWVKTNASVNGSGSLVVNAGGSAKWTLQVTDFTAQDYIYISCQSVSAAAFLSIIYDGIGTDSNSEYSNVVRLTKGTIAIPIILAQATTNALTFVIKAYSAATLAPMSVQLVEQAIRSVDIQYASGTSKTVPPVDGWQTVPPAWSSNKYIWQRTATTFVDSHVEYSDPVNIQTSTDSGIISIEEQYYLSTSENSQTGGSWSTDPPSWTSGKFIWTRSKLTWMDSSITYSDATLAKALNEAHEHIEEVKEDVKQLDEDLDQEGVFKRLTNNGANQGLYIENGSVYLNASYLRSGVLEVVDTANKTIFKADMNTQSVYLAGFTAKNNSIYYNRPALLHKNLGTYIGTDGISTAGNISVPLGDGTSKSMDVYISVASGAITGGLTSNSTPLGQIVFGSDGLALSSSAFVLLKADTAVSLMSGEITDEHSIVELNRAGVSFIYFVLGTPGTTVQLRNMSGAGPSFVIASERIFVSDETSKNYYQAHDDIMLYVHTIEWQYTTYNNVTCNLAVSGGNVSWQVYNMESVVRNLSANSQTRWFRNGLNVTRLNM